MFKNKKFFMATLLPLMLSACTNSTPVTPNPPIDDDGMFEDPDTENFVVPELEDDLNPNYVFDKVETNDGNANYEIFVRSFYDTNGDGIGDFNGVKEKLPYLKELGVKDLWLMPINPSPSYHGYDITDYFGVNPEFGSLEDFKELVNEASKLGIGIIIDLVINHCSNQNPYFIDSLNDYKNDYHGKGSKIDWFNWSDKARSGYNKVNGEDIYYESQFSKSMPDFNLDNEEVRAEIKKICEFWLDIGVKGFRLDAVLYYYMNDTSSNITFLNRLKDSCEEIKPNTYIVGESWLTNWTGLSSYYNSKIDSFFNFPSSLSGFGDDSIVSVAKEVVSANKFGELIEAHEKEMKEKNPNGVSSYFISNHDMDRSSKNLSGDVAKVAASLTYLLPGTPYVYYGEEIGLKGVRNTSPDDNSDAKRRLPMIWDESNKLGQCDFPEKNRQDLNNTVQVKKGVNDLLNENYSLTNHYKKVLNIRNKYPYFKNGTFENLTNVVDAQNKNVLIYKIKDGDNSIIVCHNFNDKAIEIDIKNIATTIVDSINTTKKIPKFSNGKLGIGAYSTVILN